MLVPSCDSISFFRYFYGNTQRKHEQNVSKNILLSCITKTKTYVISFRQDIKMPDHKKHRRWQFSILKLYYAKVVYIDFEKRLTQKLPFSIPLSSVLITLGFSLWSWILFEVAKRQEIHQNSQLQKHWANFISSNSSTQSNFTADWLEKKKSIWRHDLKRAKMSQFSLSLYLILKIFTYLTYCHIMSVIMKKS